MNTTTLTQIKNNNLKPRTTPNGDAEAKRLADALLEDESVPSDVQAELDETFGTETYKEEPKPKTLGSEHLRNLQCLFRRPLR